jgi:hypothetical protein
VSLAHNATRSIERINWRDGQLLTSRDLRDDQNAEDLLRYMHVRYLHKTWGIVEGLVVNAPDVSAVSVSEGYALDIEGRELLVAVTTTVAVPVEIITSTTMYLVISRDLDDGPHSKCGCYSSTVDLSTLCLGVSAVKRFEQGKLSWKTVHEVRRGLDVLLARILIQNGKIASSVDTSVQHRATTFARPKVWADKTQQNQTGWSDLNSEQTSEIQATVDTSNAGFIKKPAYFASLVGASLSAFAFISAHSAANFQFVVRPIFKVEAAKAESEGWTITWVGIDLNAL